MASRGLLWVGTNVGIALTVPLPRLEGVPIISGRANISYHAHFGPVTFFLNLQPKVITDVPVCTPPPSVAPSTYSSGTKKCFYGGTFFPEKNKRGAQKCQITHLFFLVGTGTIKEEDSNDLELLGTPSSGNCSGASSLVEFTTTPPVITSSSSLKPPHHHQQQSTGGNSKQPLKKQYSDSSVSSSSGVTSASGAATGSEDLPPARLRHRNSSPNMSQRRRARDHQTASRRTSKTLPRGFSLANANGDMSSLDCDVFGLYGELLNVRDYDCDSSEIVGRQSEDLRKSDPELSTIPYR